MTHTASTLPAKSGTTGARPLPQLLRLALAGAPPAAAPAAAPLPATPPPPDLRLLGTSAVLDLGAAPKPALLAPVLPEGGLMLVHGPRGVGRSHVLVGCAAALAAGDWFLGWRARRPADVLFLSGAASTAVLSTRFAAALRAMRGRAAPGDRLRLLAPDMQDGPMPALDTAQGQARLVPLLAGAQVLAIDDVSALMPGMNDNAARSQWRFAEFLRRLRSAGRTVLVGQVSGEPRPGRAERAALAALQAQADVVIGLLRPADYAPGDGARFELHVERANHLPGPAREVREIRLAAAGDRQADWSAARAVDLARPRFLALLAEGRPAPEAARELGIARTTAWRWSRQAAAERDTADFPQRRAAVVETLGRSIAASDREPQTFDTPFGIAA